MGKNKDSNRENHQQDPENGNDKEVDDILGQLKESEGNQEESGKKEEKSETEKPESGKKDKEETESDEPENIDEILEKISEKETEAPVEPLNVFQRVVGVFTGPTQVFEYLRVKPDYWTPIILTIIVSVISSFFVYDIAINDQIAKVERNENMTEERREQMLEGLEQSKEGPRRILSITIFPVLGVVIIFLLISAIFLFIGNVLLSGKASFKQILSAYGYSYLIVSLLGTIIKLPLWLNQQTVQVEFSPAVFMPQSSTGTALYRFISSFDIFMIWFLIVFAIGFAIIYRFSKLKSVVSVFTAWLLYVVLFKILLGGFFSNFAG